MSKIEHLKTYPLTLQAEQQLGFPAGAAAGASSLDTAGPTVSGFPCNELAFEIRLDDYGDVEADVDDAP